MSDDDLTLFSVLERRDPLAEHPGLARHDGSDTMKEAAYRTGPSAATQRGHVLVHMHEAGDRGLTAIEAEMLMLEEFPKMRNVRARITELRRDGWLIQPAGATRMTHSGFEAEINYFNPEAESDYQTWLDNQRKDRNE